MVEFVILWLLLLDSTISGETRSTQPPSSGVLRLKEGEFLLVWSKRDYIRVEAMAIYFKSLALI